MSATTKPDVHPFYFKSYGRTIGVVRNVDELHAELARLAEVDPAALEYHIREGHIAKWLEYADEKDLAEEMKGAKSIEGARMRLDKYLETTRSSEAKEPALSAHKEVNQKRTPTRRKPRKKPQKQPTI